MFLELQLWWGEELGVPNAWRWHGDYIWLAEALEAQQWYEYRTLCPARVVNRKTGAGATNWRTEDYAGKRGRRIRSAATATPG